MKMQFPKALSHLPALLFLIMTIPPVPASSKPTADQFLRCLSDKIQSPSASSILSSIFFTPNNVSFDAVLSSTAQNLGYLAAEVPKPAAIIQPLNDRHVRLSVLCIRQLGFQLRVRSGGHDYEGLSYVSSFRLPFIVVDLQYLRQVVVNVEKKYAWVRPGATVGELYLKVAEKSNGTLGAVAGVYDSIGVGGHITGGAYSFMMRKLGMGVDSVQDAILVDASGRTRDRRSMGEDVFWAIRGGAGASFGVILYLKLALHEVPRNVTVFKVPKFLARKGDDMMGLVLRWQHVAPSLDERAFVRLVMVPDPTNPSRSVMTLFDGFFLGPAADLLNITARAFPQLGLASKDCDEMSWIEAAVSFGGHPKGTSPAAALLAAKPLFRNDFKAKSDFLKGPSLTEEALGGLWRRMMGMRGSVVIMNPLGGAVAKRDNSATAFAFRDRTCLVQYVAEFHDPRETEAHVRWMRELYAFMAPFVPSDPRGAYANYRELDLGINANGTASYEDCYRRYGRRYFRGNFRRLAEAKEQIDPDNFFRHEQSIPLP